MKFKRIWVAWLLLIAGLVSTILATLKVKSDVEIIAQKEFAYSCGFEHVASGPLVRSSYMAEKAKDVFKLEWR